MNHNRRKFIKTSAAGSAALFLSSLETFALPHKPAFTMDKNYELLILATNWGYTGNYDSFFAKIKTEGYDGAEIWCPGDEKERNELQAAAQKYAVKLGLLYGAGDKDPKKNFEEFKRTMEAAAALKPIYINCHTAKDFFTPEQLKPFFEFTFQLAKQ